jgi:hypothetical protein
VQAALWRDRSLIKTWAMRGTLHLLAASDFPLYIAARSAVAIRRPPSYYTYHGVTPDELDAILEGVPQALSGEPLTREQLAEAVARRAGSPNLREVLLSGWGALLKPSAFRGDLCFGPSQGQNVTFVRPDLWMRPGSKAKTQGARPEAGGPARQPLDPAVALKEMARRYLNAFGPASSDDFARWWGIQAGPAKKVFRSLDAEIEAVDVEGWKAWALASTLEQVKTLEAARSVRLLPQFDTYTVGISRDCEPVLSSAFKDRVYRPQGWISAIVLVDGRIEGTWEYDSRRSKTVLKVEMFRPPEEMVKREIEVEARRLGEFLWTEVELEYGL